MCFNLHSLPFGPITRYHKSASIIFTFLLPHKHKNTLAAFSRLDNLSALSLYLTVRHTDLPLHTTLLDLLQSVPVSLWRPEQDSTTKAVSKVLRKGSPLPDNDHSLWEIQSKKLFACLLYGKTALLIHDQFLIHSISSVLSTLPPWGQSFAFPFEFSNISVGSFLPLVHLPAPE